MGKWIALCLLLLPAAARAECVVLLHGLARSDASLLVMEKALTDAGYKVINVDYPSTEAPVASLTADYVGAAFASCEGERTDFVTHSMGGILVRQWLQGHHPANLGRVVMLAPPNQGTDLVDKLGGWRAFRWVNGPAGLELGTGPGALPRRLGPVWFDLGVIAGDKSMNPVYSALIPGPDDGKVPVASTGVRGMRDHITLPVTHTFLMNNPLVIAEVLEYLAHGRFDHTMTYGQAIERLLP